MNKRVVFILICFFTTVFSADNLSKLRVSDNYDHSQSKKETVKIFTFEELIKNKKNVEIGSHFQSNTLGDQKKRLHSNYALKSIIPDFQVNENAGACSQTSPEIAVDGSGNYYITWIDERGGLYEYAVYVQVYDSDGNPQGENIRVNEDIGYWYQTDQPSIAVDFSGNFVVTWVDVRSGMPEIYAQRYNSETVAQGDNFKVSDDDAFCVDQPTIVSDSSGNHIIAWQDERNGNSDIFYQFYNNSGIANGNNICAVEDTIVQESPSLAMDNSGNFIISWTEVNTIPYGSIYARRFSDNSPAGNKFRVGSGETEHEDYSATAMNDAGEFIIVWLDYEVDGDSLKPKHIYGQGYNKDGTEKDINFKIDSSSKSEMFFGPSISIDKTGNFVLAWFSNPDGFYDIFAQKFNSDGTASEEYFKVNTDNKNCKHYSPQIAMDKVGNFSIVWYDNREDNFDIYAQKYDSETIALGDNLLINDDVGSSCQFNPAMAIDSVGNFVIVWRDLRNNPVSDIYAQRFDSNGNALGENFKVNEEIANSGQVYPDIAMNNSGDFVIIWQVDNWNIGDNIYAQRYNSEGVPQGNNFKVNDDNNETNGQCQPDICYDDSGYFIITWTDFRNSDLPSHIYAQIYKENGEMQGDNFLVNDSLSEVSKDDPAIATDGSGHFIITWRDQVILEDNFTDVIMAKMFSCDGLADGNSFMVNDSNEATRTAPDISMNAKGDFIIAWEEAPLSDWWDGSENNSDYTDVYAQRFNSEGIKLEANFKVNSASPSNHNSPSAAIGESGGFVVAWSERDKNWDILAQKYDNNGAMIDSNFIISSVTDGDQDGPKVMLLNDRIYTTWESDHTGDTGSDIWMNVLDWGKATEIEQNSQSEKQAEYFHLEQNYPNPFNPATTIRYNIPQNTHVVINVHNILGQKVRTLVNSDQNAGYKSVVWNGKNDVGKNVPSGIYIYKMIADNHVKSYKMILLK